MTLGSESDGRVAAFFDVDGTLIPKPSLEWRFFRDLQRNGRIPVANYFCWGTEALRLLRQGLLAAKHRNKRYLSGLNRDAVLAYAGAVSFFDEAISCVAWHVLEGYEIILLTGTLQELAELAASALECELETRGVYVSVQIYATRLANSGGQWTGRAGSEVLYGAAKAQLVERLAKFERIDLQQSYGYGDDFEDRYFLSAVGHAVVVNPRSKLTSLANRKNWPICHWSQPKTALSRRNLCCESGIQSVEKRA